MTEPGPSAGAPKFEFVDEAKPGDGLSLGELGGSLKKLAAAAEVMATAWTGGPGGGGNNDEPLAQEGESMSDMSEAISNWEKFANECTEAPVEEMDNVARAMGMRMSERDHRLRKNDVDGWAEYREHVAAHNAVMRSHFERLARAEERKASASEKQAEAVTTLCASLRLMAENGFGNA